MKKQRTTSRASDQSFIVRVYRCSENLLTQQQRRTDAMQVAGTVEAACTGEDLAFHNYEVLWGIFLGEAQKVITLDLLILKRSNK